MPRRILVCIGCRCEIERIDVAGGRVVAICVACEGYGDAAEFEAGVPLTSLSPQRRANARESSRIR
jgi:hypothetical protein